MLLAGVCLGLVITYLLPIALLFSGRWVPTILGAATWALMSAAYFPMVKFYGRPAAWSITLPLAALFYLLATLHSAVEYTGGRGGQWKGRNQDVRI
jgi:hypothetical protein